MPHIRLERQKHRQNQLKNKNIYISCVVPAYNEEENINTFLDQLAKHIKKCSKKYEIIVINDGSCDKTREILSENNMANLKTIHFSRNFGKEQALSAGIDHAQGDVVLLIDSDFQHPFSYIDIFLNHWVSGYDMIYGVQQQRLNENYLQRWLKKIYYRLLDWLASVSIPSHAGDFRLIDRKIITTIQRFKEHERFMKGIYAWVGYDTLAIPFDSEKRTHGKSHFPLTKLFQLAINSICSFSTVPLRISSILGFIIAASVFIYGMDVFIDALFYKTSVPGYTTLILAIMFLGGIQLISIGILGEYVGRIFNEVKRRPNYVIENKKGFQESTES